MSTHGGEKYEETAPWNEEFLMLLDNIGAYLLRIARALEKEGEE